MLKVPTVTRDLSCLHCLVPATSYGKSKTAPHPSAHFSHYFTFAPHGKLFHAKLEYRWQFKWTGTSPHLSQQILGDSTTISYRHARALPEAATTPICSGLELHPRLDELSMLEVCFFLPWHSHTCRTNGTDLNLGLVELQVQCESLALGSVQVKPKHQGCHGNAIVPTPNQQL